MLTQQQPASTQSVIEPIRPIGVPEQGRVYGNNRLGQAAFSLGSEASPRQICPALDDGINVRPVEGFDDGPQLGRSDMRDSCCTGSLHSRLTYDGRGRPHTSFSRASGR